MALPKPGDVLLDKYRIEAVLGEGGFGRVYSATTQSTGRTVAIKVLKTGASTGAATRTSRFLREMRAIAKLQSPHTITLFDYGRLDDGAPFMVCEYIKGEDLHALLARRGALDAKEAVHILRQILLSLSEAHKLGLLHRDLKPSNIRIFEYDGDPLRAKLLDFGLAKSIDGDEPALTATGNVIGTPRYMAPEQITGGELTPACDLYSAGLVAVEMLIGPAALRMMPLLDEVHVPEGLGIDPHIVRVIDRLLEHDPAKRWRTATEVLVALDAPAPVRAQPTETEPEPVPVVAPPAPPAPRTPRSTAPFIAAGLAVLSLGLVVVMWSDDERVPAVPQPSPTRIDSLIVARTPEPVAPTSAPTDEVDAASDAHGSPGCGRRVAVGRRGLEIMVGLSVRTLTAYLPTDYDSTLPHPLIVLLHESAATPDEFLDATSFAALADRESLVIVAPDGGQPFAWHDQPFETVRRAIDDAQAELCIDTGRVYLVGHSSGGGVAEEANCHITGIRAIATTSQRRGVDAREPCPGVPVPAIHLVGKDDRYNPLDGGEGCSGAIKISLAERETGWARRNKCAEKAETWHQQGAHLCRSWTGCEAPLVSCVLDGGRGWNGTGPRVWDTKNCDGEPADFPYAETIWRFFQQLER